MFAFLPCVVDVVCSKHGVSVRMLLVTGRIHCSNMSFIMSLFSEFGNTAKF